MPTSLGPSESSPQASPARDNGQDWEEEVGDVKEVGINTISGRVNNKRSVVPLYIYDIPDSDIRAMTHRQPCPHALFHLPVDPTLESVSTY